MVLVVWERGGEAGDIKVVDDGEVLPLTPRPLAPACSTLRGEGVRYVRLVTFKYF